MARQRRAQRERAVLEGLDSPADVGRAEYQPTVIVPDLLEGQQKFYCSLAPRVLYCGAYGAGKSQVLCLKARDLCLTYPKIDILLVRREFSQLRKSTIPKLLELLEPFLGPDPKEYNKTEQTITLPKHLGGSRIWLSGMDNFKSIEGMNLEWIGVDESEELDEQHWRALDGRLRGSKIPFRQIAAASNPCLPGTFQHRLFFDMKQGEVIRSNTRDNRFLPPDYLDRLASFTGLYYRRYVEGECVGAEGLVYDNYDPELHVIDPFDIPADWPRYRGIDFGYANPAVCLWIARQPHEPDENFPYPKGSLFVYRELYRRQMLVEYLAERIRALSVHRVEGELFPERIGATFADWDAEGRATLEARGIGTVRAFKDIQSGIQTVYRYLARTESGLPRLFFFRNLSLDRDTQLQADAKCSSLLEELGVYSWEQSKEGRSEKEEPVKVNDHACDALRYAVVGIERASHSPVVFLR